MIKYFENTLYVCVFKHYLFDLTTIQKYLEIQLFSHKHKNESFRRTYDEKKYEREKN